MVKTLLKLISAVAAPPTLKKLHRKFPRSYGSNVNEKGFIVPYLGDADKMQILFSYGSALRKLDLQFAFLSDASPEASHSSAIDPEALHPSAASDTQPSANH
ncbi:hypothetical protein GUJ93_ZPchr0005g15766 [Zizania palustris]|uniref:Uncharacterized protein n=1 Tax=Zizania palustris TaxID=103762 RepID=A0A8J5VIH9_ZIZPA|nr:hypothetical protein GUJ93_ZPchr0005g15766 [Zizania palustris]